MHVPVHCAEEDMPDLLTKKGILHVSTKTDMWFTDLTPTEVDEKASRK